MTQREETAAPRDMGEWGQPNGAGAALISTMPKSGTWYCNYFFEYLNLFSLGLESEPSITVKPHPKQGLGIADFYVCHCEFDGFSRFGGERGDWDRFRYLAGFNWGGEFIAANGLNQLRVTANDRLHQIYLYRNPLDQAVSFYRHVLNHKDASLRFKQTAEGIVAIESPSDLLFSVGLESYIKQYFTYHAMRQEYAGQLVMIPYESLVRDPEGEFRRMVEHLGLSVGDEAFNRAIEKTSFAAMTEPEDRRGTALGGDQTVASERHVRDGKIGKWKSHFSEKELKLIEARLNDFRISLNDFVLE